MTPTETTALPKKAGPRCWPATRCSRPRSSIACSTAATSSTSAGGAIGCASSIERQRPAEAPDEGRPASGGSTPVGRTRGETNQKGGARK